MSGMVGMAASCEECSFVHILRPTCIACVLRPGIGRQALVLSGMHWHQSTRDGSSFAASHLSLQQVKVDVDKLRRNKTSRTIICVIGRLYVLA